MQEIQLEELKQIELRIMVEFDEICQKLGLRYSLGGGTLLGAIRHKGFIPWDDDVDVMLPRPDYDKLIRYSKKHELPFQLISYETSANYSNPFAIAVRRGTILHEDEINHNEDVGIHIDIFPLDGLADTKEEALKIYNATRFDRELITACQWKKFFRSKTHSVIYEPIRFAFFALSRFHDVKKLIRKVDQYNRKHPFDNYEYVACVCGDYRAKEIMKLSEMNSFLDVTFEGHTFKAISGYDQYLKQHYGDYMQLPPKEKQVSHHLFKAYKLD